MIISKSYKLDCVYVRIIFRTPGGVYKKISDCCHDIHKGAYITLIYKYIIFNNYEYQVNQD